MTGKNVSESEVERTSLKRLEGRGKRRDFGMELQQPAGEVLNY